MWMQEPRQRKKKIESERETDAFEPKRKPHWWYETEYYGLNVRGPQIHMLVYYLQMRQWSLQGVVRS